MNTLTKKPTPEKIRRLYDNVWSYMNTILAIMIVILALVMMNTTFLIKSKSENEDHKFLIEDTKHNLNIFGDEIQEQLQLKFEDYKKEINFIMDMKISKLDEHIESMKRDIYKMMMMIEQVKLDKMKIDDTVETKIILDKIYKIISKNHFIIVPNSQHANKVDFL